MKPMHILFATCLVALATPFAKAADALKVVATTPELAWFVETIGADQVDVEALTKGREDLHSFSVKPRTIVSMAKADLLFENGLSLESTWLPDLILASRNDNLTYDKGGRVNCSEGFHALDVPSDLSRKEGDVHPQGNPHMAISPQAGALIADNVLAALVQKDPAHIKEFTERHDALCARITKARARWDKYVPLSKEQKAVVYHKEFDYIVDYLGMDALIAIEPKPGLPPTPVHLAKVIEFIEANHVPTILVAPWSNNRQAKSIAAKTECGLLELPSMMNGTDYATDWITMIDGILEEMRLAYGLPAPKFDEEH